MTVIVLNANFIHKCISNPFMAKIFIKIKIDKLIQFLIINLYDSKIYRYSNRN